MYRKIPTYWSRRARITGVLSALKARGRLIVKVAMARSESISHTISASRDGMTSFCDAIAFNRFFVLWRNICDSKKHKEGKKNKQKRKSCDWKNKLKTGIGTSLCACGMRPVCTHGPILCLFVNFIEECIRNMNEHECARAFCLGTKVTRNKVWSHSNLCTTRNNVCDRRTITLPGWMSLTYQQCTKVSTWFIERKIGGHI